MSAATALGVLGVALARARLRSLRLSIFWSLCAFAALWLLAYAVTGAHLGGRFQTTLLDPGGRMEGYGMTVSAIQDAPLRGYGAGTFPDIFFLYSDGSRWLNFNYSHNLYLGTVAELGLPAAIALIGSVAVIAWSCVRGLSRRKRDHLFPALGVAATTLVAVHGLIDSPLFIPANAVTYSFIMGVAYAQSWPTRNGPASPGSVPTPRRSA